MKTIEVYIFIPFYVILVTNVSNVLGLSSTTNSFISQMRELSSIEVNFCFSRENQPTLSFKVMFSIIRKVVVNGTVKVRVDIWLYLLLKNNLVALLKFRDK